MSTVTVLESPVRASGWSAGVGGLVLALLGVFAAFRPDDIGSAWFGLAAPALLLTAVGIAGLRQAVADVPVARNALTAATALMVLFALGHVYAVIDVDRALPVFSALMVLTAVALIVGGVAILRAKVWSGPRRLLPLACGLWPLLTIPTGAALGDVPHFLAIAVWGACWLALGRVLLGTGVRHP
jgi:hypothetical protein